jgi:hypothetical protein
MFMTWECNTDCNGELFDALGCVQAAGAAAACCSTPATFNARERKARGFTCMLCLNCRHSIQQLHCTCIVNGVLTFRSPQMHACQVPGCLELQLLQAANGAAHKTAALMRYLQHMAQHSRAYLYQ